MNSNGCAATYVEKFTRQSCPRKRDRRNTIPPWPAPSLRCVMEKDCPTIVSNGFNGPPAFLSPHRPNGNSFAMPSTGGIQAAFDHLLELAGQGELVHNDDTPMRVLELCEKIKNQQPLLDEAPERRGVFTTNILSRNEGRPPIALFFTGPHHAGENLRDLLARRRQGLPPPIQMCDPLSRNMPQDLHVIIANCLTHGRRKFVDVVEGVSVRSGVRHRVPGRRCTGSMPELPSSACRRPSGCDCISRTADR